MDWVRLHLMVNHFPIVLIMAGALATVAALFARRGGLWQYAAVTVLLAGITAPVAYVSGLEAEETVERAWYVEEEQIEDHEASGLIALIGLVTAAVVAGVMLRKPSRATRGAFAAVAILAAGLTAYAALEGGEIVHDSPALEREPPSVSPDDGQTG